MRDTTRPDRRGPRVLGTALALVVGPLLVLLGAGPAGALPAASGETAWVRAVHLVPELGAMTISLAPFAGSGETTLPPGDVPDAPVVAGERVLATAATYGAAGEYRQVPVGLYTVAVRPADADPTSDPILTGTLDAKAGQAYTLAGLGTKSDPRIQTLGDDLAPPSAGSAKVRLLPAAANARTVDIVAQGGPTVAEQAEFATPTGYAAVPDGPWTLEVTDAAADGGEGDLTTADVDLASGAVYTLLLLDSGSGGVRLQPVVDAVGMAAAPRDGVQTGGGGTVPRPVPAGVPVGLGVAALGALSLVGSARRGVRRSIR